MLQYPNAELLQKTAPNTTKIMTLWAALVQPEASGRVRLNSSDSMAFPLINTNYSGSDDDMACVLWGYKQLRAVLISDTLKPLIVREVYPGSSVTSDADLLEAIRNNAESYHHPMCSVALGKVLDSNFRIKGLQGLRVVDASVLPYPPNCHLMQQVYAVAHMAARQIKAADGLT